MEKEKATRTKTYYKTLNILKNYNKIKKSLQFLKEKLKGLKSEREELPDNVIKGDKVNLVEDSKSYYYTDETLDSEINNTKQLIVKTEKLIEFIDNCIGELCADYKDIVKLYYIQNESSTFITLKMNISEKTFYRYRENLILELSYLLFANDKVNEEYDDLKTSTDNFMTKR